jgi:hypothetical protein
MVQDESGEASMAHTVADIIKAVEASNNKRFSELTGQLRSMQLSVMEHTEQHDKDFPIPLAFTFDSRLVNDAYPELVRLCTARRKYDLLTSNGERKTSLALQACLVQRLQMVWLATARHGDVTATQFANKSRDSVDAADLSKVWKETRTGI